MGYTPPRMLDISAAIAEGRTDGTQLQTAFEMYWKAWSAAQVAVIVAEEGGTPDEAAARVACLKEQTARGYWSACALWAQVVNRSIEFDTTATLDMLAMIEEARSNTAAIIAKGALAKMQDAPAPASSGKPD